MKMRTAALLIPLIQSLALLPLHASSDASATPVPGMMDRTLKFLHLKHAPKSGDAPQIHHRLELKLAIDPSDIKLSTTREIRVTVLLYNRSKKYVELDFPTSQRVELLVRDETGKVVNTWSEDQSFTNDPASVTVNPGERLEYTVSVATREMTAGRAYTIEVSFPSYSELKIEQRVTPEK